LIYRDSPLGGVYVIELERRGDERGFFARVFDDLEFESRGLVTHFVNVNDSLSADRGTLRGMHYQLPPQAEVKLVRCIRGSLFDVVLDLRPESPTYKRWYGTELSAKNRLMMYVPTGCAHGFLTLEDDTEAFYFASAYYSPELERGIRWNDAEFDIDWPLEPVVVSQKDRDQPDFDPSWHLPS